MQGRWSLIVRGIASTAGCANYSNSSRSHAALPAMVNRFAQKSRVRARSQESTLLLVADGWLSVWQRGCGETLMLRISEQTFPQESVIQK